MSYASPTIASTFCEIKFYTLCLKWLVLVLCSHYLLFLFHSAPPILNTTSSFGPSTIDLKNRKKRKVAEAIVQPLPALVVKVDDQTENFYKNYVCSNGVKYAKFKKKLVLFVILICISNKIIKYQKIVNLYSFFFAVLLLSKLMIWRFLTRSFRNL